MTLKEAMLIADEAYPDGLSHCVDRETWRPATHHDVPCGDTLRHFVAMEVAAIFQGAESEETNLRGLAIAFEEAAKDVSAVADVYATHLYTLMNANDPT